MIPEINVTPLIDILLVLLIIFMVISPLKPAQFEARIPSDEAIDSAYPNPETLIVRISSDSKLSLNLEDELGTINEPAKLSDRLKQVFSERSENRQLNQSLQDNNKLALAEKIQKTVFLNAPKSIAYGEVVRVIDEIKLAGANPISLQVDDLD